MKLNGSLLLVALVSVASFLVSSDAEAVEVTNCTVARVGYDGSPRLAVHCSGQWYYGFGTSSWSGCNNRVSTDTLKAWQSMATSALLSGRKVNLGYEVQPSSCTLGAGARTLTHFDIVN